MAKEKREPTLAQREMAQREMAKQLATRAATEKLDQRLWALVEANPDPPARPWTLLWTVGRMGDPEPGSTEMIVQRRAAAEMVKFIRAQTEPPWSDLRVLVDYSQGDLTMFVFACEWLVRRGVLTEDGFNDDAIEQILITELHLAEAALQAELKFLP